MTITIAVEITNPHLCLSVVLLCTLLMIFTLPACCVSGGALRPAIEVNIVSPSTSSYKKKFITNTAKSHGHNPHFNETFKL